MLDNIEFRRLIPGIKAVVKIHSRTLSLVERHEFRCSLIGGCNLSLVQKSPDELDLKTQLSGFFVLRVEVLKLI